METWKYLLCLLASQLASAQDNCPGINLSAGLGPLLGNLPLSPISPCLPSLPQFSNGDCTPPLPGLLSGGLCGDDCLPSLPDSCADACLPSLPNLSSGDCCQESCLPSLPNLSSGDCCQESCLPSLPPLGGCSSPCFYDDCGPSDCGPFVPYPLCKPSCVDKCALLKEKCALLKAKCLSKLLACKTSCCDKKLPLPPFCLKKGLKLSLGPGCGLEAIPGGVSSLVSNVFQQASPCAGGYYDDCGC